MDEILKIESTDVLITSKFFMTLKDLLEGDSFVISRSYSSEDYSLVEIDDISHSWDITLQQEIIDRFKYTEDVSTSENFGKVLISFSKNDYSEIDIDTAGLGEAIYSSRIFSYEVTVTALSDIKKGSLLMI